MSAGVKGVLVVDDSAMMRKVIGGIFGKVSDIRVVGEAGDGQEAMEQVVRLNPDVITLDINMPVMDGITALKHIMIRSPKPVVMCSTLTQEGESITFDALKFGAVDFIHKPSNRQPEKLEAQYHRILQKVRMAADAEISVVGRVRRKNEDILKQRAARPGMRDLKYMVAIGAGEGGYRTLLMLMPFLRADSPAAFLVVLHESTANVDAFTRYLQPEAVLRVQRVRDQQPIKPGVCYMASGDEYVTLAPSPNGWMLHVTQSPFPDRRGSIDMLMFSMAEHLHNRAVGVILTGSGRDGAEGIMEVVGSGGVGVIQHPDNALHKEMPENAMKHLAEMHLIRDLDMAREIQTIIDS